MNKARNNIDILVAMTTQTKQLKYFSIIYLSRLQNNVIIELRNNDGHFMKALSTMRRKLTYLIKFLASPVLGRYRRYMTDPVQQRLSVFERQLIETKMEVEKMRDLLLKKNFFSERKLDEPHKKLEEINNILLKGKYRFDEIIHGDQNEK